MESLNLLGEEMQRVGESCWPTKEELLCIYAGNHESETCILYQ